MKSRAQSDSDAEEEERMARLRGVAVEGKAILLGGEEPRKDGSGSVQKRSVKPSVRGTMFGEEQRDQAALGEEREYQRHASVKLMAFLDTVIDIQDSPATPVGPKKKDKEGKKGTESGIKREDGANMSGAGFRLFSKSDPTKPLKEPAKVTAESRWTNNAPPQPTVTIKRKGREDDDEADALRRTKSASAAITAEAIVAFANDLSTLSGGDPAKIIPGVRARPKGPTEKPKEEVPVVVEKAAAQLADEEEKERKRKEKKKAKKDAQKVNKREQKAKEGTEKLHTDGGDDSNEGE